VNRTLQQLRVSQVVEFQRGEITVKNWKRLAQISQSNPAYLHLKKPPFRPAEELSLIAMGRRRRLGAANV
jgi:hypothetical protein